MRASIEETDSGYDPWWHTTQVEIFLDGVKIDCAVTADTETGYIKCFKRNEVGERVFQELHGIVEIKTMGVKGGT